MLECRGLTVSFGQLNAVDDVTITIPLRQVTSVIGANGAGKTTLLRAVSGLKAARSGRIIYDGLDIANRDPSEIVRLGVCHVPAGFQLFRNMTVEENLWLGAYIHTREAVGRGASKSKLRDVYDLFPVLEERRLQQAGTLSGGQQQMVAIGRALMARPKLLLLDEPSLGLAPLIVKDIMVALGRLKDEQGLGIVLVEQNAALALEFASVAYLLENGRVVESGPTDVLRRSGAVAQAYLGA